MIKDDLPKTIKIGPYEYKVIQVNEKWHRNHDCTGLCNTQDQLIFIYLTGRDSFDLDTLWHEIKHAVWHFMNLHDSDDEERTVTSMTSGELMVLKDNPDVLNLLHSILIEEE